MSDLFKEVLSITLWSSAFIAVLLCVRRLLSHRISAGFFRLAWLVLALRLAIPFNLEIKNPPVKIDVPAPIIKVQRADTAGDSAPQYQLSLNEQPAEAAPKGGMDITIAVYAMPYVWGAGAALFMAARLCAYGIFRLSLYKNRRKAGAYYAEATREQFGRRVAVYKADVSSPMLVGFVRQAVYLPYDVDFNALPYILAHEARHSKCGDILYQYVMLAAQSIHWFNPLVHIMVHIARRDMELACDAAVLGGKETAYRQAYGMAVLSTIATTRARALTTCFSGSAKSIKVRFAAMFDSAKKYKCTAFLTVLLVCVIFTSTLVACNAKSAEPLSVVSSTAESTASSIITAGFWDNSVIIGDRIAQGFSLYDWDGKENVKFCTYTGVTAQDILDNSEGQNEKGEKVKMLDDVAAKIKDADKVVVMLGVNSAVKDDEEKTAAQTGRLVEYVKQTAPNVQVIVCLASNVTAAATSVNAAQVSKYNYYLAQWCEENGIEIKDFPNELNDEYGNLDEAYAAIDGVHFKDGTVYKLWAAAIEWTDISSMVEAAETDTLLWAVSEYYRLSSDFGAEYTVYGEAKTNDGIDIPAPLGTPVYAAADGSVILPESDWSLGTVVTLDIGKGMTVQYGNLSARSVNEGQIVKRGETIGYVGSTGNSTGNHLHFSLTKDGTAVDPKPFFDIEIQEKLKPF